MVPNLPSEHAYSWAIHLNPSGQIAYESVWCAELGSCKDCSNVLEVQLFEACQQDNP